MMEKPSPQRLVLASGSPARAAVLRGAGLDPVIDPADVDERAIENSRRAAGAETPEIALVLARAKAMAVSGRHPGALVLGADQMMDCGGDILHKPAGRNAAFQTLEKLAGREHCLITAACLARDGAVLWSDCVTATLSMRALTAEQINAYLNEAGDGVLASVGAYRLEETGSQLFDRIEGDYFTILGLPLLPLMQALREQTPPPAGLLP